MAEWRELSQRHRLEMHFPRGQILAVWMQLVSAGCPLPPILAEVDLPELHAMASNSPSPVVSRAVWSDARAAFAALPSTGEYLVPAHELFTNDDLVLATSRHTAKFSSSGSIAVRTKKKKMRAHRSFSKMGPRRIRIPNSPAGTPRALDRYIKDSTHANRLKQVKGSLPGMAPAFRCNTAFCKLRKVAPIPDARRGDAAAE